MTKKRWTKEEKENTQAVIELVQGSRHIYPCLEETAGRALLGMSQTRVKSILGFLEKGVNPDALVTLRRKMKVPLLTIAAAIQSEPMVDALLKAGANPNQAAWVNDNDQLITPLWALLRHKNASETLIYKMMDAGANVFQPCASDSFVSDAPILKKDGTPLDFLLFDGRLDLARRILERMNLQQLAAGMGQIYKDEHYAQIWGLQLLDLVLNSPKLSHLELGDLKEMVKNQQFQEVSELWARYEQIELQVVLDDSVINHPALKEDGTLTKRRVSL